MIVAADDVVRYGWAPVEISSGNIYITEICEDQESAHALLAAMKVHQPHRKACQIKAVSVAVRILPAARS